MIEIKSLSKLYGDLRAVDDISCSFPQGSITAIMGPNGAGKSTMMKSLLGLVRPDSGEILIDGQSPDAAGAYRAAIGYMPQSPRYPENLTVAEIFSMILDLRGNPDDTDEELFEKFQYEYQWKKRYATLSGGNKQKASAILSFLFRPSILILDEPTAGLDPLASSIIKEKVLRKAEEGCTILLSSHSMGDIEDLADSILYMLDGKILFHDSIEDFIIRSGEERLEKAIAGLLLKGKSS